MSKPLALTPGVLTGRLTSGGTQQNAVIGPPLRTKQQQDARRKWFRANAYATGGVLPVCEGGETEPPKK